MSCWLLSNTTLGEVTLLALFDWLEKISLLKNVVSKCSIKIKFKCNKCSHLEHVIKHLKFFIVIITVRWTLVATSQVVFVPESVLLCNWQNHTPNLKRQITKESLTELQDYLVCHLPNHFRCVSAFQLHGWQNCKKDEEIDLDTDSCSYTKNVLKYICRNLLKIIKIILYLILRVIQIHVFILISSCDLI